MLIQTDGGEVSKGLFEIVSGILSIAVYPLFFFALAAALTPTVKPWRRIVGGVIASTLALGLLYHLFTSASH
jgi:uncharacterized BrkB/YihY/UPF0761 family membrane protein